MSDAVGTNVNTLARVEAGWNELMSALDGLPRARMAEPGAAGDWSVKDVLGHVAYWEQEAADSIESQSGGDEDWQATNDREAAARADRTADEIWDELLQAHDNVVAALRAHPELEPAAVADDTYEHYEEHAADIRAWRQRVGL